MGRPPLVEDLGYGHCFLVPHALDAIVVGVIPWQIYILQGIELILQESVR